MAYTDFTDALVLAVDKVCSSEYEQMFEIVARDQPNHLSREQNTVLSSYPRLISWYEGDRRPEIIERIRRTHLKWFNDWLSEHNTGLPPYIKWGSVMTDVMLHTSTLLFRLDLGDLITSEETRNQFRQIADTIKRILLSISKSNSVTIDEAAIPLVQELLALLFYLTLDSDLAVYLKSLQLVDLMTVLIQTSNNDDEIHLQAYRILAVIMAESDIKQLQNSSRIASVFIAFIGNTIDGGISYEARLHNSLRSLKG
jgi:hypothetical protein